MRFEFLDCVLDTELCELVRGNEAVSIRPKVMQVLTYLIENSDRVVSKQELFEQLWNGRVVGDATLNSCLKEARRAVGDNGREQRILKTLHGHGYHFIAPLVDSHGEKAAAEPASTDAPLRAEREYKQVSILACAVQNAEELATTVGPEEMDVVMRGFLANARAILERYNGTETERHGDGFTALFGAPLALEDHARRAALAAMELAEVRSELPGHVLKLQIGLHTGRIVVGSLDETDQLFTAAGATTKIAHQIRDAADASILASADIFELIETDFGGERIDSDGGLPELVSIRTLSVHRGGVPQRAERKSSRFVGRDDELNIIRRRFALARSGAGQAVCISGEPGIGKSRLLQEIHAINAASPLRLLQANCLAYRQSSPYFPLVQLLRQACGVTQAENGQDVATRLRERAGDTGIGALLAVLDATTARDAGDTSLPQINAEQVFMQASRIILEGCKVEPLVIAIEDLHWIDATTEQWLASFVRRITGLPVVLLVTYRPGYQSAWLAHSFVTQLALPRLNDTDSATLIGSLSTSPPEIGDVQRQIVINAQGNPFFLEELASNFVARDANGESTVPTTVQAVLASRIDQLQPADKLLLQSSAVIGTAVSYDLLAAISKDSSRDINDSIRRLEDGEFLYEDPTSRNRHYYFKHALTRDVAYQSLLSSVRRNRHRHIADAYEQQFPELAITQPELVAYHFTEAGVADKAMSYWRKAGVRAAQRSANPEAVTHFEKALKVSESLPKSDELKMEQLEIYLILGPPLMSSKAFTSPAVEVAYQKARRLCDEVGTKSELLTVLWGLWLHYAHRGRINEARPLAQQIFDIAGEVDDDALMLQAHHAVWTTEVWHGDLQLCDEHARAGLRLYDRHRHASHKYLYGSHDPGVCAHGTAAISAWFLGKPDEAIRLTREGANLAKELDHPYSRIITLFDYMEVEALRGDHESSGYYARLAIDACIEQGVPNYLAVGHIFAGYCAAKSGDLEGGVKQLKDGLQQYRDLGAERLLAPYLLLLAELFAKPEHVAEGMQAVEEAAELIIRTGEVRWDAEIKRVKGEMLMVQSTDNTDAAETLYREALKIAAEQGCRSFELRAATSLARLLLSQNNVTEARDMLAPIYDWFTEGFDTRDLRQAADVLQELR